METVHLGGIIVGDDLPDGAVLITVFEWYTYRCGDEPHITVSTHPGNQIGQTAIALDAVFEITVEVSSVGGSETGLAIVGFVDVNENGSCDVGTDAMGVLTVAPRDNVAIELPLESGECYALY